MATIKSFTDLQQSKKLAQILSLESADMFHFIHEVDTVGFGYKKDAEEFYSKTEFEYIPCWSLAALLDVLPRTINFGYENDSIFVLRLLENGKYLADYYEVSYVKNNPIDACYEMILKLHELKML